MRKCDEHKEYQVRVWTESEYEKGNGCPHCSYGLIYKDRCVICLRSPIAL
jgi:DNA-directed RNA polymerase subunit RPC12/RpoP